MISCHISNDIDLLLFIYCKEDIPLRLFISLKKEPSFVKKLFDSGDYSF